MKRLLKDYRFYIMCVLLAVLFPVGVIYAIWFGWYAKPRSK